LLKLGKMAGRWGEEDERQEDERQEDGGRKMKGRT
jgi:hypothetical protein